MARSAAHRDMISEDMAKSTSAVSGALSDARQIMHRLGKTPIPIR